jgi:hypothetical protein
MVSGLTQAGALANECCAELLCRKSKPSRLVRQPVAMTAVKALGKAPSVEAIPFLVISAATASSTSPFSKLDDFPGSFRATASILAVRTGG